MKRNRAARVRDILQPRGSVRDTTARRPRYPVATGHHGPDLPVIRSLWSSRPQIQSATSKVGRDMTAGCYAGGWPFPFFLNFLRGSDRRSRGLSTPAIMPVATRV